MTRDEVLRALRQARSLLLETIDGIPADVIVTQPVTEAWTIKDLLGHIAMWQQVALSFITDYRAGGTPQSLGLENDAAVDTYNYPLYHFEFHELHDPKTGHLLECQKQK